MPWSMTLLTTQMDVSRGVEDDFKLTRLTAGGYTPFLATEAGPNIPDETMARPSSPVGCRVSFLHTRPEPAQRRADIWARQP